jgi:hypothetical protein
MQRAIPPSSVLFRMDMINCKSERVTNETQKNMLGYTKQMSFEYLSKELTFRSKKRSKIISGMNILYRELSS